MNDKPKRNPIWDLLLICGCLALAAGLWLTLQLGRAPGAGVIVRVAGAEAARYSLADSGTYPLNGGTNVLVIEGGKARMEQADCPDHLCVNQGAVWREGQVITCLPNKLTVTVYGGTPGDADIIT